LNNKTSPGSILVYLSYPYLHATQWYRIGTTASPRASQITTKTINKLREYFWKLKLQELYTWNGQQAEFFRSMPQNTKQRRLRLKPMADAIHHSPLYMKNRLVTMILKGRLQLLGNEIYHRVYKQHRTGRCPRDDCTQKESTKHIFNAINHTDNQVTERHNAVQHLLVQELQNTHHNIITDKAVLLQNRQRPDISHAVLNDTNKVQIGEFTVCFDTLITARRAEKQRKYEQQWIPDYQQQLRPQGLQVQPKLATFVVGSLGTIDDEIFKNLALYNIKGSKAKELAAKMAMTAARHSQKIWNLRCAIKWHNRRPRHFRDT
jgi:hypothetical protein